MNAREAVESWLVTRTGRTIELSHNKGRVMLRCLDETATIPKNRLRIVYGSKPCIAYVLLAEDIGLDFTC